MLATSLLLESSSAKFHISTSAVDQVTCPQIDRIRQFLYEKVPAIVALMLVHTDLLESHYVFSCLSDMLLLYGKGFICDVQLWMMVVCAH